MRNRLILFAGILIGLVSCQPSQNSVKSSTIVCTTGMIGDMVKNLVGDSLHVLTLMGPGVDPHLYKATQGDISALSEASVIVYNGLHLEGKMTGIFEKLSKSKTIIAVSDGLSKTDLINSSDFEGAQDPHIWFDVSLWSKAMLSVSEKLQKAFPNLKTYIQEQESRFKMQLDSLHQYCKMQTALIPENQRIMITAHDAFKYFGGAYNLEVRGLQGISTTAEFGLKDISNLVQFVTDKKIKAIFVETSVPQKSIEAVIEGCDKRGHQVALGGELFSDALGSSNTAEGNYIGMVQHNVNTIVKALK